MSCLFLTCYWLSTKTIYMHICPLFARKVGSLCLMIHHGYNLVIAMCAYCRSLLLLGPILSKADGSAMWTFGIPKIFFSVYQYLPWLLVARRKLRFFFFVICRHQTKLYSICFLLSILLASAMHPC